MVKEVRKIILSRDEIIAALESYRRTNFEFLPPGKIVRCEMKDGTPVNVGIEAMQGEKIRVTNSYLDSPRLLEPLIRFCLENKIVLPRNSRKVAMVGDNQASLLIQINTNDNI